MENTTKEKILDAALVSFAENGYKGTNLRDLAAGMGLSKSALYKHYASKEDIWNAVLERMEIYYTARFGSPEKLPPAPKSCDDLFTMTMRMLDFTMHDTRVILTRKLLLTEQFRDERARQFATLHFLSGTKDVYMKIFAEMMENGILKKDDPDMLAFAYTSPISTLIHYCDREPEKESEIMRQIEAFVRHFIKIYKKDKNHTQNKALAVIDIQNDITKHYKDIIGNINAAVDWAVSNDMHVVYIKHNNITDGTRTFKPGTKGAELVPELKVVSDNIFIKTKSNALTSGPFAEFIKRNGITEFYIAGADATACVKSTCFNMTKAGYAVHVFSNCVTSYDLKKIPEMLAYYEGKGCKVKPLLKD